MFRDYNPYERQNGRSHITTIPKPSRQQTIDPITEINRLRQQLEQAHTEAEEWQQKYLRLYADYENGRKRLEQRSALEAQQKQEKLLRDMLPLADNLERAIKHTEADTSGLAMVQKAFIDALAKYGVEKMDVAERPFSPEQHEAIGLVPHPTAESGTIIAVEENGYTYQGSLLRPAKVLVAQ
ncbi:MAG: nucleotide exchange factor GrpE [Chloroflexi bacterium]|nr:MAG: nucleotide exchange factor GrpE [Chloroflexota bacterium]